MKRQAITALLALALVALPYPDQTSIAVTTPEDNPQAITGTPGAKSTITPVPNSPILLHATPSEGDGNSPARISYDDFDLANYNCFVATWDMPVPSTYLLEGVHFHSNDYIDDFCIGIMPGTTLIVYGDSLGTTNPHGIYWAYQPHDRPVYVLIDGLYNGHIYVTANGIARYLFTQRLSEAIRYDYPRESVIVPKAWLDDSQTYLNLPPITPTPTPR